MSIFEWLIVGSGLAVAAWLAFRLNKTTGSTSYSPIETVAPVVSEEPAPVVESKPKKAAAKKAPAKRTKKTK